MYAHAEPKQNTKTKTKIEIQNESLLDFVRPDFAAKSAVRFGKFESSFSIAKNWLTTP